MRLFARTLIIGAVLIGAAAYLYSPSVARALVDSRYTPHYWTR